MYMCFFIILNYYASVFGMFDKTDYEPAGA